MQEHSTIDQADPDRDGIEHVAADALLWGGHRRLSARDAVAAAKRNAK